jgi:TetR/AcrR family transcriptional repressor of nem operon
MRSSPATSARDRLLEAAEALFLARGYGGAAVDEVCAAAGASKGSFYHHFESKEALGLAVLEAYYERGLSRLMDGPFHEESDPIRRCLAFLDHAAAIAEDVWAAGCVLGSFALELGETSPALHGAVSARLETLTDTLSPVFEAALEAGGRSGEGPSGRDLAEQFLAAVEGSIVLARAHGEPVRIPVGIRTYRRLLESYVG